MGKDYTGGITEYLNLEIETLQKLDKGAINDAVNILEEKRLNGSTIYICGNGGSAATASHFVCDFNKGVSLNLEKKYRFICLNDNIPSLLAIANDMGYDRIFVTQLEGKITAADLLICLSGSGNSKNVLLAAEYAKSRGAQVLGITGFDGGELYKLADYRLHVPVNNMQIAEDIHQIFDHLIMRLLIP